MNTLDLQKQTLTAGARPIATLPSLQQHLQWAIQLEHFTIPPYLCALYSLDRDRNPDAVEAISSVMIEEMLHMTLAANLLNSVGGKPQLDVPEMLPGYPNPLPHGDRSFQISLAPFGVEAINTFMRIERPSPAGGSPEGENYETIGQFYAAIEQGLRDLSADLGEANVFCGDPARQVTDEHIYTGGGRMIVVNDLASALTALNEIVEQGEGATHGEVWDGNSDVFHPDREELAHFYRFEELKFGRRYRRGDTPQSGPSGDAISIDPAGIRPMRMNPRSCDHAEGSPIRLAQDQFNCSYCGLLQTLEKAFNGTPQLLGAAIGAMYTLRAQAEALIRLPTEDGLATAGPTFEYVAPDRRSPGAPHVPLVPSKN